MQQTGWQVIVAYATLLEKLKILYGSACSETDPPPACQIPLGPVVLPEKNYFPHALRTGRADQFAMLRTAA